ncbi:MAG: dihydroorotate dehydrogenase-like protein [Verrucomicrobia bacterium]|nr:dihydroorotate dehydrogenase-like protein [Verrucomicrobiota bacterium]
MVDLTTKYLGLTLKNPLVPSASALSNKIDNIKKMEDAGASAVVLESLFEEQIRMDSDDFEIGLEAGTESYAEALSYFPKPAEYRLGPEMYLKHVQEAKTAVKIPIIASLNGASVGGWTEYAKEIQQAGADALELNIYYIPTDLDLSGAQVEQTYLDILKAVKKAVTLPVAVKLSPFFSSTGNMAKRLDEAGADALVLFNRFYQPDINLENLEVEHSILWSTPQARRLPLRWVAILYGRVKAQLAATSGVHNASDVLKMLMAGAAVTQLCSVIYKQGIDQIKVVEREMVRWMEEHEYESVQQMQGCLSQKNCPDPSAFERAQYMRALSIYKAA